MTPDQINAAIAALQALLPGQEAPPVYPRYETIKGVRYYLHAPLNPLYKPGMYASIFGSQGGTFVRDPSSGADPDYAGADLPLRSPAGFPLFYAIGLDANKKPMMIGTPSVLNGDGSYNNDAEVLAAIEHMTRTAEQIAANRADWDRVSERIKAGVATNPSTDGTVQITDE